MRLYGWTLNEVDEQDYEELLQVTQWLAEDATPGTDEQGEADDSWLAHQRQQYKRLKHKAFND